ncbi:hypothetical protein SAMN05421640_0266 [Ekhidna lutea]|uniref:Uncharacterized protein n=1 Tax=Ekhidna lutea TaxID=447679 RepID=A0A239ERV7_EKHLU|nr:hypothetical protein [Ekhidna lutea]SNS46652.1 hypothetical protein SAMN05421640_0266 [Ekhidna lutea]
MKSPNLSQRAIDLLGENGYSFKSRDGKIIIKHRTGIMGIVVLLFVTIFLSIPVFSAGVIYGVILIVGVIATIVIKRIFFSQKSSLTIDLENNTFTAIIGTYHQENQPLKMISTITLHSQFIDEYTTAARNSVEEYLISIRVQLITKEELTLFQLKSEQSEPTPEVNEVYSLLEESVKSAKVA